MAFDDKGILSSMLGRANVPFDLRHLPERWRGKDDVPPKAESEISVPPHGKSEARVEFYFDALGQLIGAVARTGS